MWTDLPEIIGAFFIGAAALTAVLAVGARIAFKPIMESWLSLRRAAATDEVGAVLERRVALLETETETLRKSIQRLAEAEEFRRQLELSEGSEAPTGNAPRLVPPADTLRSRG